MLPLPSSSACFYWQENIRTLNPVQKYPTYPEIQRRQLVFCYFFREQEEFAWMREGVSLLIPNLASNLGRSWGDSCSSHHLRLSFQLLSTRNAPALFKAQLSLKYVTLARKQFGIRIKKWFFFFVFLFLECPPLSHTLWRLNRWFLMNGNSLWTKELSQGMIDCA